MRVLGTICKSKKKKIRPIEAWRNGHYPHRRAYMNEGANGRGDIRRIGAPNPPRSSGPSMAFPLPLLVELGRVYEDGRLLSPTPFSICRWRHWHLSRRERALTLAFSHIARCGAECKSSAPPLWGPSIGDKGRLYSYGLHGWRSL